MRMDGTATSGHGGAARRDGTRERQRRQGPPGAGSVYQRASDGRWVAALRLPGGGRAVRYAQSEREARRRLAELLREHGAGRLVASSPGLALGGGRRQRTLTLGAWWDTWIQRKQAALRPSTYTLYQGTAGRVVAELAKVPLSRLSPALLAGALGRLQAQGMGNRALNVAYVTLRNCFAQAMREGYLPAGCDPLAGVDRPRYHPKARVYWTLEQTRRFLDVCAVSDHPLAPMFMVAVCTGARKGELLGLRWQDVDLDGRRMRIQIQRTKWGLVPVKTPTAVRWCALPAPAVAALRRLQELIPPARRRDEDFVFVGQDGRPPHPNGVRVVLKKLCQAANVPMVHVHGLRHIAAALALAGGGDPVTVARALGHRRPSLTLDQYAYAIGGVERVAVAVERALQGETRESGTDAGVDIGG
jgi:integrase